MDVEYYKLWSRRLGQDMEFKAYGHTGKPLIVFPSACGRFYEFEDFGMVDAVASFIEAGRVRLYTLDSIDCEAWLAHWMYPGDRGACHEQYEDYVMQEVLSFIREHSGYKEKYMTVGCSMGAYHAANFFFKHPDSFDGVIALSGIYGPEHFVGNYMDDAVYFNFPLCYLPRLTDSAFLEQFRRSQIVICVGQGAWEEDSLRETRALEVVLHNLDVPARFDYWGLDVDHDWPWWRKQLPYLLEKCV